MKSYYSSKNKIHSTAIVSPYAEIGEGNVIGAYAVIHDNVKIGNNNRIGSFTVIGDNGEVKRVKEFNGKVIIGNDNFINHHVTIDRPIKGLTLIGDRNYIMTKSHIGHDVIVVDDVVISSGAMIGGHCVLKSHCNIGLNAEIHQRISIEIGAMIGMGSSITKDVKKFYKVVGVNRVIGRNTKKIKELDIK